MGRDARRRTALLATGLLSLLLWGAQARAQTSVLIWPIDPVIEADQKAGALWLENRGTEDASLQIRIFGWRQGDFDDQYQNQREIIGSPPVAKIAAGQKQLIRLTRTGATPPGQEKAYRIIIDEIPPAQPQGKDAEKPQAAIRFQMRYSVPLFVYGEGLWGKPDPNSQRDAAGIGKPQLSWRQVADKGRAWVEIRNTGPVHARLTDVVMQQGGQNRPVVEGLLGYVLPGAVMRWPAPVQASVGSVLKGRVNGGEAAQTIGQGQ